MKASSFYWLWIQSAWVGPLRKAERIELVVTLFLTPFAFIWPVMSFWVWAIPFGIFVATFIVAMIWAPYQMHREETERYTRQEQSLQEKSKALQQRLAPRFAISDQIECGGHNQYSRIRIDSLSEASCNIGAEIFWSDPPIPNIPLPLQFTHRERVLDVRLDAGQSVQVDLLNVSADVPAIDILGAQHKPRVDWQPYLVGILVHGQDAPPYRQVFRIVPPNSANEPVRIEKVQHELNSSR